MEMAGLSLYWIISYIYLRNQVGLFFLRGELEIAVAIPISS